MATVQDVVLELTNNRNFYQAFISVLSTAHHNKYRFGTHDSNNDSSFRANMMSEITRYYKSRPFDTIPKNNQIIAELVSHYSEECFGFYVPVDQALGFMKDGWKLSTHEDLTPFQKRGWTANDRFVYKNVMGNHGDDNKNGLIFQLKDDDGTSIPKFKCLQDDDIAYCCLECLTKIDDSTADATNAVYKKQDLPNYKEGYRQAKKIAQYMHNYGASQQTIDKLTGDKPMNPQDVIKTKILVFGDDASGMTDDELFHNVQRVEAEIERLETIKTKPKKLEVRIAEMKSQLDELIKYIDSRP